MTGRANATDRISNRDFIKHSLLIFHRTRAEESLDMVHHSAQRLVEALSQLHSSFQKFLIAETLSRPTFHHLIDAEALFPAKLLVEEVCIVNCFGHSQHFLVANTKVF